MSHRMGVHHRLLSLLDLPNCFGPDAIRSTPGRMFVLFGELLECSVRSALPIKTNRASEMLNRWQSTGVNT